ncbi:hypothetical protein K435DRAFT_641286 [Dendrothele bispora CBS 962.96]|uniref:Uncharacterized protein n=1 Tax=Dendrothele bispora (strain CBS 962.96) TaxID=1314807 RepID=A0A4S8MXJ7_DENBC|nr:hypothetical protein K435DRAFT_641286 [Dendrothele bispora CBS 962.96]
MTTLDFSLTDNDDSVYPSTGTLKHSLPAHRDGIHIVEFGGQAGAAIFGPDSAEPIPTFRDSSHGFAKYQSLIPGSAYNKWAPFQSRIDWQVAQWAKMRGTGSTAFSDLLDIDGVPEALGLSYRNSNELDKIIDTLPMRRPAFTRKEVVMAGESFDVYKRDILDCIRALYGSPEHAQYLSFTPERHYSDPDQTSRLYHDLHTGKWWWNTQVALEKECPGATIIPVIISTDKTQVTLFRNKSAYPVYLTIGNLPKEIRRKPSQQGQILLAYLPTTKLEHISNKAARRRAVNNLFHACMGDILAPLKHAGAEGTIMQSGDGVKRRCHPILASYVSDYPEQVLVTCGYYNDSPVCMTKKNCLGNYPCDSPFRDPDKAMAAVKLFDLDKDSWIEACRDANMKPVQHPFWEDLPYVDIFRSITPDILHQMHQGIMKHLIGWLTEICGADEIDARIRRLPPSHGIRHFHKGISSLSRVTGQEHKQICAFLLGVATDIPSLSLQQSKALMTATRALVDFLYLACYPVHSDTSLTSLEGCLETFHSHKSIFTELNVRNNFNLPKLHSLCHYVRAIKLYGTTDNYSTETTERLHIDFAKDAYSASNKKDEYSQMTKWLERREKVLYHSNYVTWRITSPELLMQDHSSEQRFDFPGALRTLDDMTCPLTQHLTHHPTVKSVPLSHIEAQSPDGYGATQFALALRRFVAQFRHPELTAFQVLEMADFISLPFTKLSVWHRVKFLNNELYDTKTLDMISAYPRRYVGTRVIQNSRFDAALIRYSNVQSTGGYLTGTRIGQVRVIFTLPENQLYKLFPPDIVPPGHLAYVEWFTPFSQTESGMYRVKRQMTRDGTVHASVVPLSMILHSVQLFPKWGGSVPVEWTREMVLEQAPSVLLSPYRDIHTYFNIS